MRIIAGGLRGRVLKAPPDTSIRPSSERLRGAVFDILTHGIDWPGFAGAHVLDLFAGTGAFGFEALSRGAVLTTFVDNAVTSLTTIRENARILGVTDAIVILAHDATTLGAPPWSSGAPFDLAFLDPPYHGGAHPPALRALAEDGWLKPGAILVVELAAKESFAAPDGFRVLRERRQGAGRFIILRHDSEARAVPEA